MSEYFVPGHFVGELQNGEDPSNNWDLDAISAEHFGAEFWENEVLNFPDESADQQDVGSIETPEAQEQPQEAPADREIQLPFDIDDLFEDSEPEAEILPEEEMPPTEILVGSEPQASLLDEAQYEVNESVTESVPQHDTAIDGQQQVTLPSGDHEYQPNPSEFVQGQPDLTSPQNIDPAIGSSYTGQPQVNLPQVDQTELDTGDNFSAGQPLNSLANIEQLPNYQWDVFASPEWRNYIENAGDYELEDILGTSGTPTMPQQSGNAVQLPGPSDVQVAATAVESATAPPAAANDGAVNDGNSDEPEEQSEEADTPDQPTFETYEENDPLIQADNPQRGWGRTGTRNGQEVWFNPDTSLWQPSATHHDMRETLITRAQAEYPDDRYLHPDPTDGLPHGETAFFKPHQNRGPDRNQCADELFVWREYQAKKDEKGKPIRRAKPIYSIHDHPGFMYVGGRILLDPHNNPVVNHKDIPLTLSTYTDGGKLQEMALKPGCRQLDLWARMPRWEKRTDKNGRSEIISLRDKNTRINMPMTRFREKKGTLAGGDREGTQVIMDGLSRFYETHHFDPVAAGNTVKPFPRDLEPWEVKQVRLGNTARFGGRAGNRALDDEQREDNLQKTLKSIENGKKKQAAKNESSGKKRPLEDDAAGSQDSSAAPAPQKRRRTGHEVDPGLAILNEGYAGPHGMQTAEQGRHAYGIQGNPHRHQGGLPQVPRPSQVHMSPYGAAQASYGVQGNPYRQQGGFSQVPRQSQVPMSPYGAAQASYQHPGLQGRPQSMQHPSGFRRTSPNIGTTPNPAQRRAQQAPYGGVYMQATRSPYENRQAQVPYNNNTMNNGYYAGGQYPRGNTGTGRAPTFGPEGPQLVPPVGNRHVTYGIDRRNMVQSGPTPQSQPGNYIQGPASGNTYGQPVQRQANTVANAAPRPTGNTLGPGGRGSHQAPQQVLGKRGRQVEGEAGLNHDQGYGSQQQPIDVEATPDIYSNAPPKRRRTDGNHEIVPQQPRPGHNGRTPQQPRPQYYGPGGAPSSLIRPDASFSNPQPTSTYNDDAEDALMPPEELFRQLGGIFDVPSQTPPPTRRVDQGMANAPTQRSEYIQHVPQTYEPRQVLGKHRRDEYMNQSPEASYVPRQNLGQQGPQNNFAAPEHDVHMPGPKRRRMPGTEGYYAPPAQTPRAQVVRNAHRAERDAHLPSPQLYTDQHNLDFHQVPQVGGAVPRREQHNYINDTRIYTNQSPYIARNQAHPLAPLPPQTRRQTHPDIRDVRPSNSQESQSLHDALGFTREVYYAWTGEEAPVTNLEDSYNVQYREIRAAFRVWWGSMNNPHGHGPMPDLWRMQPWNGSIEDWQAP